jgi:hypothetical protein
MSRVLAHLLRCAIILLGYCVACLGASAFLHLIAIGWAGLEPRDAGASEVVLGSFLFSVPFVALFVAYFGFIPAAAVILVAEVLGRRDWLFYALGGGIVGAIFIAFVQSGDPDFALVDTAPMLAIVGAGMVGGIFYWLSAGRWAGAARQPAAISNGS